MDARKFGRELFGLFLLFWSLLLFLSLASFNAADPSFNHVVSGVVKIQNKAGLFGAYTAGFLNDVFGVGAFLWPFIFGALGAAYVSPTYTMFWWRWCGFFLLTIFFLVVSSAWDLSIGDLQGGGMVGEALRYNTSMFLSPSGAGLIWFFVLLVGVQLVFNISWFSLFSKIGSGLWEQCKNLKAKGGGKTNPFVGVRSHLSKISIEKYCKGVAEFFRRKAASKEDADQEAGLNLQIDIEALSESPAVQLSQALPEMDNPHQNESLPIEDECSLKEDKIDVSVTKPSDGEGRISSPSPAAGGKKLLPPLPDLNLLTPPEKRKAPVEQEDRKERGEALITCFEEFGIKAALVHITPGPVVTMYEVRPAPGIRLNKIANLSDEISLRLKALSVRIQAPIPGTDTVGIEIPNKHREIVNFRELAESSDFAKDGSPLTMILGKDIVGRPALADLARMPHLLIAGATGAGKSVCLNAILVSLLLKNHPSQLKFLLVDPKRVEMAIYADEPHLVHPVVTDMADAKNALVWAVHEMDTRFKAFERLRVRNIADFNIKLSELGGNLPPQFADLEKMPYLVIIIDELADLIMTAGKEVEESITRLAQLSRAAGIHMILATQRPSVNVVTGAIKANFPCRISFQVTSKYDSATILDQPGAEQLLGRGDMLFKSSSGGGRLQRLHAPLITDGEVEAVVSHWKHHLKPSYQLDLEQWSQDNSSATTSGGADVSTDSLYPEIVKFAFDNADRLSISLLQRQFSIGFNRAAKMKEQLERDGIIVPNKHRGQA